MKRELAISAFLTLLLATVFSANFGFGLLLLAATLTLSSETLFGLDQPAGNVDETNVVGWRIYYLNGTTVSGSTFLSWTLASSSNVVAVVFFLGDEYDFKQGQQTTRKNYVKLFANETNYWFVDGLTYGGNSTLPVGLPIGAAKSGATAATTDQEATDRLAIYNTALADRAWVV